MILKNKKRAKSYFDPIFLLASVALGILSPFVLFLTSGEHFFIPPLFLVFVFGIVSFFYFKIRNELKLSGFQGLKNFFKEILKSGILPKFKSNLSVLFLICIYIVIQFAQINWGIPNASHPFPYHMDEWHQLQALRGTFLEGSPNIEGAAHGTILQFVLSGLYLIPFVALGIINPSSIASSVDNLQLQSSLFVILRTNTIIYGIGVVLLISYVAQRYFKVNKTIAAFLTVFNPSFILLSNYFKYDISLLFWICVSFLTILRFIEKPILLRYVISSIAVAVAISVKVSALPLVLVLLSSLFIANKTRHLRNFLIYFSLGILSFFVFLYALGLPDIFKAYGEYVFYISDNTTDVEGFSQIFTIEKPFILYVFQNMFPTLFGSALFYMSTISIFLLLLSFSKQNKAVKKNLAVLLIYILVFSLSLLSMKWQFGSNRALVLLPFIVIGSLILIKMFMRSVKNKILSLAMLILLLSFQLFQTIGFTSIKIDKPIQVKTSSYLERNLPKGSVIGLENIPLYQHMPELVVKEFYFKQYGKKNDQLFDYKIVSSKDKEYPRFVLISNATIAQNYFKDTEKKQLIKSLLEKNYIVKKSEKINLYLDKYFGNEFDYYLSGLIAMPYDITIYEKN